MKILYHHRTRGRYVEGVHIRGIVNGLREMGHTVYLVSPPGADPFRESMPATQEGRKTVASAIMHGISRHAPQILFEIIEILYNLVGCLNIWKVMKRNPVHFIYERYALYNVAGVLASRSSRAPLLLEVNEVSGLKRQRPQVLKGLAKRVEKFIFERTSAIITVSSALKKDIIQMGIDPDKVHVVPNAVDIRAFDPMIDGSGVKKYLGIEGKIVLGFVGSFSVWDNLEFLVDVFADLYPKMPHLRLVLIGDGYSRANLAEDVRRRGLHEAVTFTGRIKREMIVHYIAALDIGVIPHSSSGSPVVLFEYMAMAKPVVAPRILPIMDVLQEGVEGLLFDPGSKRGLIECIRRLVEDDGMRLSLGSNARASVVAKHQWRQNASRILDIYSRRE